MQTWNQKYDRSNLELIIKISNSLLTIENFEPASSTRINDALTSISGCIKIELDHKKSGLLIIPKVPKEDRETLKEGHESLSPVTI